MLISTPTSFSFNGQTTDDFELFRGYLKGLPSYTAGMNRENQMEKVLGIDKAFSYGTDNKLFDFELQIFSEIALTISDRMAIRQWFEIDKFADLRFFNDCSDDIYEDVVFLCKLDGESEMIDFGDPYGMTLNFVSQLPYATTNTSIQRNDLSDNTGTTIIDVFNSGNLNEFFTNIDLTIVLEGTSTSVKLENLSANGYTTEFTGLTVGDTIKIKYEQGEVYLEDDRSYNLLSNYTFPDEFGGFFGLVYGHNKIQVTGECTLEIVARYPLSI